MDTTVVQALREAIPFLIIVAATVLIGRGTALLLIRAAEHAARYARRSEDDPRRR